jgi:ribosomal-protein-alanine N-acetyltransferase
MRPPEKIVTECLILRMPRIGDAPAIFAGWTQDPDVTRYLSWRPHQRLEQAEVFIQNCLSAWQSEARFPYMLTLRESGEVIGVIDPSFESSKVGIGYGLARAHWGKGYMTEATRAVIDWAFQQPAIYRVYATTDVENVASRRVMEKAGMQCEGVLRKYMVHPNISDMPRDCYLYAIVK